MSEDSRAVLFLDNGSAHLITSKSESANSFAEYLLLNVTSLIQPIDQGAIQNSKADFGIILTQLRQWNIYDYIVRCLES